MKKVNAVLIILIFLIGSKKTFTQKVFDVKNLNLELDNGHLIIYESGKELVNVLSFNFNFISPSSVSLLSDGNEEAKLKVVYPGVADYQDSGEDLIDTIKITKLGNGLRFFCDSKWAKNITIKLRDMDEHYFGVLEPLFPNNEKTPDLRNKVVDVDVLGNGNQYHENYSSVWSAFFMSSNGYASFFDSFAKGQYRFATNGITELYHRTGKLDWYIFYGPTGDKILKSYYSIIGNPKYVPNWACGPIIWRDEDKNGKIDIISDAQKLTDLKIPFTAFMVDRPYSNGTHEWSKMDFNDKFSNPKEWISELNNKYNVQFLSWVGSLTFGDKDFPGLLPNFKGYIDLSNPDGIKEFERRLKTNMYSVNVRGHKMDRADEEFPEMARWYDKTPFSEHRNKYVYLFSKVIDQFLQNAYGKNQFNFARAAFHRTQPYLSAVWGGDSRSSWDGLAGSIANSIRCGFMGFPVWGSDVGGYLGGWISEELYARWLEFGTWSGMMEIKLDHSGGIGKDRPPWKYNEKLQSIFRNACSQRMEMFPYIYSASNTSYKNGVLMKPLAYAYPGDENTYGIWDEYLFGNAFLVAPIYDSTNTRTIYLPEGNWYDFNDIAKIYKGGKTINISTSLDKIPVFVKSNSVYITGNIYKGNDKLWNKNNEELSIHIFPGSKGERFLYSYVDLNDADKEKNISIENENEGLIIHLDALKIKSKIYIKSKTEPSKVIINDTNTEYNWDKSTGFIETEISNDTMVNIKIQL